MTRRSDENLQPRNGHTLVVDIIARISGCANQKEMSLDDQVDHAKEVVAELYEGPVEYRIIATKGKGERLDRPELEEIEKEFRSGEPDLAVQEDVGRLVRGADAVRLWGVAVDHGIRCIAPNDCCDTADDNWEQDLLNACAEHVGHNAHTSKRIKQKKMNRFKKFGGATPVRELRLRQAEGGQDVRGLAEGRRGDSHHPGGAASPEGHAELLGRGRLAQPAGCAGRQVLRP